MAILLKQSTASQEIPLGYFVDSTDGNTEETGLTIANTDIKLWKSGATTLANKNSGGATHISNGIYYAVLDATDTDTLGPLVIFVHASGALAIRVECLVLAANVYDSLVAASDSLQVDAIQVSGTAQTAADVGAEIAKIPKSDGSTTFNSTCVGNIKSGLTTTAMLPANFEHLAITDTTGLVSVGTNNDKTGYTVSTVSDKTGYSLADGAITATTIATDAIDADAIKADAVAEIQNGLATATGLATVAGYIDTEVAAIKAKTDNLPASPAATGDIPAASAISDAVWDEALVGHAGVGSAGAALSAAGAAGDPWSTLIPGAYGAGTAGKIVGDNLNSPVGTVDTVVDAIKAKTDNLPAVPAAQGDITALNDLSSAQVESAVDAAFNNAIPGSPVAGSINAYIQALKWAMCNKMEITNASGNTVIYKDDGSTPAFNVNAMFSDDSTTTVRKAAA